jgi:Na+-transporting methylmalonyl-CoA/oxaloacetate decarboxylase gamma subunit
MNRAIAAYVWFVDHPTELILLVSVVVAISFLIGASIYAVLKAHEEAHEAARLAERRQELDAAIALSHNLDRLRNKVHRSTHDAEK